MLVNDAHARVGSVASMSVGRGESEWDFVQSGTCELVLLNTYFFFYLLAGLGEFRIRDLNDEINKLLREKRHWEERILELGGPDHNVRSVYMYMLSSSKSCIHTVCMV